MNYTNVGQVIWSLWAELKLHSGLITQNVQGSVLVQLKGNKAGTLWLDIKNRTNGLVSA